MIQTNENGREVQGSHKIRKTFGKQIFNKKGKTVIYCRLKKLCAFEGKNIVNLLNNSPILGKIIYNKTPAQAFTPPADEKETGTIWIFVYYAVYGSGRGRCRDFLVLKWGGGVLICKYGTQIEHMKQKELFFQYYRFSACVDANYDIKESIKDIQQTVQ